MKFKEKVAVNARMFIQRIRTIISGGGTPYAVAMGFFIGTLVGWTPTMGIQMMIAAALAFVFRCNKLAAIVMVWITNPLTFIPMYWLDYKVGKFFMKLVNIRFTFFDFDAFSAMISEISQRSFLDAFLAFFKAGSSLYVPMFVGGTIIGVVNGLALGIPIYLYMKKRRRQRAEKEALVEAEAKASVAAAEETSEGLPGDEKG